MGNRAIVKFKDKENKSLPVVYSHWNGGPESVFAFLSEMERRKWTRMDYAPANFTSLVVEFFRNSASKEYPHDGLSVGVFKDGEIGVEGLDNGEYVVSLGKSGGFKIKWKGKTFKTSDVSKAIELTKNKYRDDFDAVTELSKKYRSIKADFIKWEALIEASKGE